MRIWENCNDLLDMGTEFGQSICEEKKCDGDEKIPNGKLHLPFREALKDRPLLSEIGTALLGIFVPTAAFLFRGCFEIFVHESPPLDAGRR